MPQADRDLDHLGTLRKAGRVVHVLAAVVWIKCGEQDLVPWPFCMPPLMLTNTRAECIFQGLSTLFPAFGPWSMDTVVKQAQSRWIWYIMVGDGASSNKRLFAQLEMRLIDRRPGILFHFAPCLVHVVHRCVIPVMQFGNLIGDLFRASHVLSNGLYWQLMTRAVQEVISSGLVVVHALEQSPRDRLVARQVLDLTMLESHPQCTDKRFRRLRLLRDELLNSFIGDWSSPQIRYRCQLPGCHGQLPNCRRAAVAHASLLTLRCLFDRRITIPSLNRWWKFLPLGRLLCIGTCFHGILGHATKGKDVVEHGRAPAPAAGDDGWRAIHTFRVRKTAEFFQKPSTATLMLLVLQAMRPAHLVMSWLMAHEADLKRLRAMWSPDLPEQQKKSRLSVALDVVSPSSSPIWAALELGQLLLSEEDRWLCAFAHNTEPRATLLKKILFMMLPVLARIWWRGMLHVRSWPVRLLRTLDPDAGVRAHTAQAFATLRPCCMPRGVKHLQPLALAEDRAAEFVQVVKEFGSQLDFSNFEMELHHSRMRSSLAASGGNVMGFAQAAEVHLSGSIGMSHQHLKPPSGIPAVRGRPALGTRKRKRFCPWNAFVRLNRPTEDAQGSIKRGDHMKDLGVRWRRLSHAEREPYVNISVAKLGSMQGEIDSEGEEPERAGLTTIHQIDQLNPNTNPTVCLVARVFGCLAG